MTETYYRFSRRCRFNFQLLQSGSVSECVLTVLRVIRQIPVRHWSSPGFVRLSHLPTPTVIGSSLKPLVTSALSKYSHAFSFTQIGGGERMHGGGCRKVCVVAHVGHLHTLVELNCTHENICWRHCPPSSPDRGQGGWRRLFLEKVLEVWGRRPLALRPPSGLCWR